MFNISAFSRFLVSACGLVQKSRKHFGPDYLHWPHAVVLRSQRILSDSDFGLKISTPTPLRLRPNKNSILKEQYDAAIFLTSILTLFPLSFHFQTGYSTIRYPFAQTANAAGRGYRWFLWMWAVWQSLNLSTQSQNDHNDHKIISDILYQTEYCN